MLKLRGWREIPIGGILVEPGSAAEYRTGDWRLFRPVIDYSKCIKCLLCWIYCPEPAVVRKDDDSVEIDYYHCKGCGICASECPVKAISMMEETR
ncbi:MAG: pyruvate synthase subunit PorD [Candidatus Bathyarchaeia archaeon]